MPRALGQNSACSVKFPKILHSHPRTSSLCRMNSKGQSTVVRMFVVLLDCAEAVLHSPRWVLWEGGGCTPCHQSAVNSRTRGDARQLLTLPRLQSKMTGKEYEISLFLKHTCSRSLLSEGSLGGYEYYIFISADREQVNSHHPNPDTAPRKHTGNFQLI